MHTQTYTHTDTHTHCACLVWSNGALSASQVFSRLKEKGKEITTTTKHPENLQCSVHHRASCSKGLYSKSYLPTLSVSAPHDRGSDVHLPPSQDVNGSQAAGFPHIPPHHQHRSRSHENMAVFCGYFLPYHGPIASASSSAAGH